jgi:Type I phosphodiesterase / nucleotide pyrophosphatase
LTQPETPGAGAPVDELRQRLRSLGYLDAGVDRFVLAPAHGARGAAAIALLASVRIGLLGGMLLGPTAAVGVATQLPGLVATVRDGVVIAVYTAVLFGAGIAAAALAAGLLVSVAAKYAGPSLARHGRLLSIVAGVAIAIASLAYLTLLWTAVHGAATGGHETLWMVSGLAFAVGISLLLGHAVTLTALALVVTGTAGTAGTATRRRGVPGASWRAMLAVGAVAFAAALLLFFLSGRGAGQNAGETPRLTVVSGGLRVRLLAIDGFDPAVFDALASDGRLPALAEAFGGARARLALNDSPSDVERLDPARLWTTIATAQPAAIHGVQTLETRRVAGMQGTLQAAGESTVGRLIGASTDLLRLTRPSVASGSERKEKTFWEVAADAGLRTVVVNWWATWPATSNSGVVLSDRATLRFERGGALDAEMAPPQIYQRLAPGWPALRARASALATDALAGASADGEAAALVRRSAELDAITLLLAQEASDTATDLSVVYLPGLDIAQHALFGTNPAGLTSASAVSARLASLESYYVALDRLLAQTLRPGPQELVVLVTAPGRVAAGANGRLIVNGSAARAGIARDARATDVAPTLLHALGLPISQTLAGTPQLELFAESFVRRYPVRQVTTYGGRQGDVGTRRGQPLDQEMIDRMRSLGYVR